MTADPQTVRNVPVDIIRLGQFNTRRSKKSDPEILGLAKSIGEVGLLNPLTVRNDPREDGALELIAGERRFLALQVAGIPNANVVVVDVDDLTAAALTIVENLQREPVDPVAEAEAIRRLLKKYDRIDDIAAMLGQSRQWIARRAKLLDLCKDWWNAVKSKDHAASIWTFNHLEMIARYDVDTQLAILEDLFEDDGSFDMDPAGLGMSIKALSDYLNDRMMELRTAPWDINDDVLFPEAGACSACPKRSSLQSDLFGDVKGVVKRDRCLDLQCWSNKGAVAAVGRIEKAVEKTPGLVAVRTTHRETKQVSPVAHLDIPELTVHDFRIVKKSDDGAVPAMYLDGVKAGQQIYVKPYTNSSTGRPLSTEPKRTPGTPTPLSERRKTLERRRNKAVIERVVSGLVAGEIVYSITPQQKIALAIAFGTRDRNEYVGSVAVDRTDTATKSSDRFAGGRVIPEGPWYFARTLFESAVVDSKDVTDATSTIADRLFVEVLPVIARRFKYVDASGIDQQIRDLEELVATFKVEPDLSRIQLEIEDEIPEPTSWAKLNADGTPKAVKSKKGGDDAE